MPTRYKIYVFNKQSEDQKMWCFLSAPEISDAPEVFANSNAFLTVPMYTGSQKGSFTIPLQYKVAVGASNQAVGLDTLIEASDSRDSDLEIEWEASYFQDGHNKPPVLKKIGTADTGKLALSTNKYDKKKESANDWYGNMSFGVESAQGFMGVTWSPKPNTTYQVKPKVTFYVSTGTYTEDYLADITIIQRESAVVTDADFDGKYEATVILETDGSWTVKSGYSPPSDSANNMSLLLNAHNELSQAHNNLTKLILQEPSMASFVTGEKAERESSGVTIKDTFSDSEMAVEFITGTVTITAAIGVGFAYMIASGIKLKIVRTRDNGTSVDFSYDGGAAQQAILNAFAAGKEIFFGSN